jgi:hypothetical protein
MANTPLTRQARPLLVAAAATLSLTVAAAAGAGRTSAQPTSGPLASLRSAPYSLVGLDRRHEGNAVASLKAAGAVEISHRLAIWRLPSDRAERLIPALEQAGDVRDYQPDRKLATAASPFSGSDSLLPSEQWWLSKIGADRAGDPPGPGTPVTVIDSGVDVNSGDLQGRAKLTTLNPQSVSGPAGSEEYHGTAVASIIGAPADGKGLVGVYPQANLFTFDASPSGALTTSAVIDGLDRAERHGPGVVNLSLGGELLQPLEQEVILDAFNRGLIVVAAAGNDRKNGSPNEFPANYTHVLTVGATDQNDNAADFSTQSRGMDLAAPGVGIYGPVGPGQYGSLEGTSFSAPMVSAAAGWLWTARPDLDKTQVMELLRRSARDVGVPGRDIDTGFGVLDIAKALAAPAPAPDPSEPNDDVDQVISRGVFGRSKDAITTPLMLDTTLTARLDASEDPKDVYRVWVGAGQKVTASLKTTDLHSAMHLNLELWRPSTPTTLAHGWQRHRDLVGSGEAMAGYRTSVSGVNHTGAGAYFYVAASIPQTSSLGYGSYDLAVKATAPAN